MGNLHDTEQTIDEVLAACGAQSVERLAKARWKLSFSNGEAFNAMAVADDDWLAIEVQTPAARKRPSRLEQLWDCLAWNANLPGGVKFALLPQDRCTRIRAELPLEEGSCPAGALHLAALGLKVAFHRLSDKAEADELGHKCSMVVTDVAEAKGGDWGDLCASAGWKFTRRASGCLSVELETPASPCQAIVAHRGQGMAATVQLAACEGLGQPSRHATALMLLTACGLVRMIRATAAEADGRTVLGYEVAMEPSPTAGQLSRGLSALSVACGLCGQHEIAAMQDESVAERYLAVRGWAS